MYLYGIDIDSVPVVSRSFLCTSHFFDMKLQFIAFCFALSCFYTSSSLSYFFILFKAFF